MTADGLNKQDNPAMIDWELASSGLYGAVIAVNFSDLLFKTSADN